MSHGSGTKKRKREINGKLNSICMEESFLSAELLWHLHVLLLLGHLVVLLLQVAYRPDPRPGHDLRRAGPDLLHQLAGHFGHHVRIRRHSGPAWHQAQTRHLHLRRSGTGRPVRAVRICPDAHRRRRNPLRRRAHRLHRAVRRLHGRLLPVRGGHRTLFP